MTKRIYVPLHFIRHGKIGGVENAANNLFSGLLENHNSVTFETDQGYSLSTDFLDEVNGADTATFVVSDVQRSKLINAIPSGFRRFFQETQAARRIQDSFDFTIFANYFCPPLRNKFLGQKICIIHDLQFRTFPHFFSRAKRWWLELSLRITFKFADKIVFISQAALDDAKKQYPSYFSDKWTVVPNAISWDDMETDDQEQEVKIPSSPYILSVAHHYPHKNLNTLVKAFAKVASENEEVMLVLTGQKKDAFSQSSTGYSENLIETIHEYDLENRILFTGFVSRADLGRLYQNSRLFAFPSLFEGFGMPPVEAMGFGIPALVSDIPVLREVTLGKAEYVSDYKSPDMWARMIKDALAKNIDENILRETREKVRKNYDKREIAKRLLSQAQLDQT